MIKHDGKRAHEWRMRWNTIGSRKSDIHLHIWNRGNAWPSSEQECILYNRKHFWTIACNYYLACFVLYSDFIYLPDQKIPGGIRVKWMKKLRKRLEFSNGTTIIICPRKTTGKQNPPKFFGGGETIYVAPCKIRKKKERKKRKTKLFFSAMRKPTIF